MGSRVVLVTAATYNLSQKPENKYRPFGKLDLVQKRLPRVITMQSKRTFIAAISIIMLRLTIFLEIMKALNEEMTI